MVNVRSLRARAISRCWCGLHFLGSLSLVRPAVSVAAAGPSSAAPHLAYVISRLCSLALSTVLVQCGERELIDHVKVPASDHNHESHRVARLWPKVDTGASCVRAVNAYDVLHTA